MNIAASIITCVNNQLERFFIECADSVGAQDADIEWIIADDCSADDAVRSYREILKKLCPKVPTTVIVLPRRSGLSRARNAAINYARGDWIVVLDSDDRLSSDLCKVLAGLPSGVQLACFEVRYFDDWHSEHRAVAWFEKQFASYGLTLVDPFLWFDFYYHGIIARRTVLEHIGGYRDHLTVGEDQDILLRATESLAVDEVKFFNFIGYEYRKNQRGVCYRHWAEVERNYASTMLAAANRRGACFTDCHFAGIAEIDGANVDMYEYESARGSWLSWKECRTKFSIERV